MATAPSPATSGTSLVVTASSGGRFPTVPFNAVIWPAASVASAANAEIVRVTARTTDTLTITRTQESTSARTVIVGDQIAASITVKSFTDLETSPQFAGTVGIGAAPLTSAGLYLVTGSSLLTASQAGIYVQPTATSAATSAFDGILSQPFTAASAFTCASVTAFHAQNPSKGATSTITSAVGVLVDAITSGNTNNYGVDIGTPSGGSGDNLSLRATGAIRFSGLGAFAASDKYVIIDSSGNLHKSGLGPAS